MDDQTDRRIILSSRASWADSGNRALRRRVQAGELQRLRRGAMRPALAPLHEAPWAERPEEARLRYLDLVCAVGETRRRDVVFSHVSALAIHALPYLGPWPRTVDIVEPVESRRRSKHGVVVHRGEIGRNDIEPWGGFFVTSVARTIADLSRSGDVMAAVVALDHAIGLRARPEQSVTKDEVRLIVEEQGPWGATRAFATIAFADPRSGSPGESGSRVRFAESGFAAPELQFRHPLPDGGYYDTDFRWPGTRSGRPLIGEFDGVGKYLKPEYLQGMTPGEAVVAEKKREDALRALYRSDFMRWGMAEVMAPRALAELALAHGVPRAPRRLK